MFHCVFHGRKKNSFLKVSGKGSQEAIMEIANKLGPFLSIFYPLGNFPPPTYIWSSLFLMNSTQASPESCAFKNPFYKWT